MSFLELYNEEIRDMLAGNSNGSKDLTIHEDTHGIYISGLTERKVISRQEMCSALVEGSGYRTVASTLMNQESSRSHAIFSIIVNQYLEILKVSIFSNTRFLISKIKVK